MGKYYKTRVRPKGQITLPGEIRELLELSEGDNLVFSLNEQGQVVISRLEDARLSAQDIVRSHQNRCHYGAVHDRSQGNRWRSDCRSFCEQ